MNGDNKEAHFVKDECIAALTDSLAQCDSNSDVTHGFTASVGSIDYNVDLSGVTQDGNPPWNEKPAFPAPEFAAGKELGGSAHLPICYPSNVHLNGKLSHVDLEIAINAFCLDSAGIKEFGKY